MARARPAQQRGCGEGPGTRLSSRELGAGQDGPVGWMWPVGRSLPTSALAAQSVGGSLGRYAALGVQDITGLWLYFIIVNNKVEDTVSPVMVWEGSSGQRNPLRGMGRHSCRPLAGHWHLLNKPSGEIKDQHMGDVYAPCTVPTCFEVSLLFVECQG